MFVCTVLLMTPMTTTNPTSFRTAGRNPLTSTAAPLIVNVAVPVAGYYLLTRVFGIGAVPALAIPAAAPALGTIWTAVKHRRLDALGMLMLAVTAVALAITTVTGDARLMLAKDSAISGVVGLAMLATSVIGRPLMSTLVKPMMVKDDAARLTAWEHLTSASAEFRGIEKRFSALWGMVLLADSVARVVVAYTRPIHTAVWLTTVFMVIAVVAGMKLTKPLAARIGAMLTAETQARS